MEVHQPDLLGNYVLHDNIDINGTINYTNRYKLYNQIESLVDAKIAQTKRLCWGTLIRINLNCPDIKPYKKQTERLFNMLTRASQSGVNLEVNVVSPLCLDSWAGKLLLDYSTPGYRNVFQGATIYRLREPNATRIIIPEEELIAKDICDTIFMENGIIKTR